MEDPRIDLGVPEHSNVPSLLSGHRSQLGIGRVGISEESYERRIAFPMLLGCAQSLDSRTVR